MRRLVAVSLVLLSLGCASRPSNRPNDREFNRILADYHWLERLRGAPTNLPPSRKQQIESLLETQKRIESTHAAFLDRLKDYFDRTADPRAARLYANERIRLGDTYMVVLARYDRAITMYESALAVDPQNEAARKRLDSARTRRFVALDAFSQIRSGMSEQDVQRLVGMPREDWIKQISQRGRVYSVWIFPKRDGGASAVYFDNGVVYHTNWNAAPPKTSG